MFSIFTDNEAPTLLSNGMAAIPEKLISARKKMFKLQSDLAEIKQEIRNPATELNMHQLKHAARILALQIQVAARDVMSLSRYHRDIAPLKTQTKLSKRLRLQKKRYKY